MTPRSGLTLIEVAVSMALLSALFLASSWWIAESGRIQAERPGLAWERSAEALLLDVERRLREGDEPEASGRVEVEGDELRVRGRGQAWAAFEFRPYERAIVVGGEERALGEVAHAEFELDEDLGKLRVRLSRVDGREVARRWRLR